MAPHSAASFSWFTAKGRICMPGLLSHWELHVTNVCLQNKTVVLAIMMPCAVHGHGGTAWLHSDPGCCWHQLLLGSLLTLCFLSHRRAPCLGNDSVKNLWWLCPYTWESIVGIAMKGKEEWFAKWNEAEVKQESRTLGPFSQFWGFLLLCLDGLFECSIQFDLKNN